MSNTLYRFLSVLLALCLLFVGFVLIAQMFLMRYYYAKTFPGAPLTPENYDLPRLIFSETTLLLQLAATFFGFLTTIFLITNRIFSNKTQQCIKLTLICLLLSIIMQFMMLILGPLSASLVYLVQIGFSVILSCVLYLIRDSLLRIISEERK